MQAPQAHDTRANTLRIMSFQKAQEIYECFPLNIYRIKLNTKATVIKLFLTSTLLPKHGLPILSLSRMTADTLE